MKVIKAVWTGEYPNLCRGEWVITIDGVRIEDWRGGSCGGCI